MEIVIRTAELADVARLSEIAAAAKEYWSYPAEWIEMWRAQLTITPADLARCTVRVATRPGGVPIGFAAATAAHPRWTLEHLWVDPRAFGHGIGRRLLRDALQSAHEDGAVGLTIDSDPYAADFYLHCGARPAGVVAAPMPGAPQRTLPRFWLDAEVT